MYLSAIRTETPLAQRTVYSSSTTPSRRTLSVGGSVTEVAQRVIAAKLADQTFARTAKTMIDQAATRRDLRTKQPPLRRTVSVLRDMIGRVAGDSIISDRPKVLNIPARDGDRRRLRVDSVPVNTAQPISLVPSTRPPVVSSNPIDSYAVNEADIELLPTETVVDAAMGASTFGGKAGWLILGLVVFGASMLFGSPPARGRASA